jgi:hypothetical protein
MCLLVEATPLPPFALSIPHAACKHGTEQSSFKRFTEFGEKLSFYGVPSKAQLRIAGYRLTRKSFSMPTLLKNSKSENPCSHSAGQAVPYLFWNPKTTDRWSLSWATLCYHMSVRLILISSSHLRQILKNGLSISGPFLGRPREPSPLLLRALLVYFPSPGWCWMMSVEHSVGLSGETEVLWENLPQFRLVYHKSHIKPGLEPCSPGRETDG